MDISPDLINQLKQGDGTTQYILGDCRFVTTSKSLTSSRNMRNIFEDHTFGIVIDKGTIDALHSADERRLMLKECFRILKPNGLLISIAFSDPSRLKFLAEECQNLSFLVHTYLVRSLAVPKANICRLQKEILNLDTLLNFFPLCPNPGSQTKITNQTNSP